MANAFFDSGRYDAWAGALDFDGSAYRFILMGVAYTRNLTTQEDWADISTADVDTNPEGANLGTKTIGVVAAGVIDAADLTPCWAGPNNSGANADEIVLALDTGTPANDRLVLAIDTASAGLPFLPNGGNINLSFSASGIASLGATS